MGPSIEQIEAMIAFVEANVELALGRATRTREGRAHMQRLWERMASHLNGISVDCPQRDPKGWRHYFTDFKFKLQKKIKNQKKEQSATGGGGNAHIELTPLQDRLYAVIGRDFGEQLPGVRHNPISVIDHNNSDDSSMETLRLESETSSQPTTQESLAGPSYDASVSQMMSIALSPSSVLQHDPWTNFSSERGEFTSSVSQTPTTTATPVSRRRRSVADPTRPEPGPSRRRRLSSQPDTRPQSQNEHLENAQRIMMEEDALAREGNMAVANAINRLSSVVEASFIRLSDSIRSLAEPQQRKPPSSDSE